MSTDGRGTKRRRNIAENFNLLSRAHECYTVTDDRHTTDGRAIAYSERDRKFTFAKNGSPQNRHMITMKGEYEVAFALPTTDVADDLD